MSRIYKKPRVYRAIASALPSVRGLAGALRHQPLADAIVATNLSLEGPAILARDAARRTGARFVLLPFAHLGDGRDETARRYISMPHQRELVQAADMVVALTSLEAGFLIEMGGAPGRIVVAGAGVDVPAAGAVAANPSRVDDRVPTIVSVGALAQDKGTTHLVNASRLLETRGVSHRLVLIGPEMAAFSRWFEHTGADQCRWIERPGIVSEARKHAILSAADVFVLASRTESFGIVYLEAWAHRKPVIGARAGAVTEVINHGKDGLLVPFGDEKALAAAIAQLVEDRALSNRLGQAGFEKVEARYTWDRVMANIARGFQEILGLEVGNG